MKRNWISSVVLRSGVRAKAAVCCLGLVLINCCLTISYAEQHRETLERVVTTRAAGQTAIMVIDVNTGSSVYEHQSTLSLVPASVMKLVTAAVALRTLGPDYSFTTKVLLASRPKNDPDLIVQGSGDPSLRTEELWSIARQVRRRGVRRVNRIILDASAFESTERVGQRAYEAAATALAFNYNSITLEVCPQRIGSPARVVSDPWEYPVKLTGSIVTKTSGKGGFSIDEVVNGSGTLTYRLNGVSRAGTECNEIYRSVPDPISYFGIVLREYLNLVGVAVSGPVVQGVAPSRARLIVSHKSKSLGQIVEDMNQYSNNMIAEQLLIASGGIGSKRKSHVEGRAKLARYAAQLGCHYPHCQFMDGSGLSPENKISPRMLTALLRDMWGDARLSPAFVKSLSVSGSNGTLKHRPVVPSKTLVRAKTGTLTGVTSLAGYLWTDTGRLLAFAILQNRVASRSKALEFERWLLAALNR